MQSLLERFLATVAEDGTLAAVLEPDGARRSFAELDGRAARAAAALAARGIGPGSRVAISMPRGFDFLACMLGVMRTGAAYTPLDEHLPEAYVAGVLSRLDPQLRIVGAEADAAGPCAAFGELDLAGPAPLAPFDPDAPAYIMFTSGSTGEPKGVVIPQGALARFVQWCAGEFAGYRRAPILNVANFSFDQSVLDLALTLALGCPMALLPARHSILDIAGALERHRVALVSTVPNTFTILLSLGGRLARFDHSALRCVVLGGAAFPRSTAEGLFAWKPDLEVLNLYGPTEAAVYCLRRRVLPGEVSAEATVALGEPFPGMRAHLLDPESGALLMDSPAEGELVLEGGQVMSGYLGDPEKTRLAMRLDCPELAGARAYRTGDMVRRDQDGELYFRGRRDDLIKTSGYRVSLLAVEQAALRAPGVAEAGAVALPDPVIENRIVLFAAPALGEPAPQPSDIAAALAGLLPAAMQPRVIRTLPALPKNSSGKISKPELLAMARQAGQET